MKQRSASLPVTPPAAKRARLGVATPSATLELAFGESSLGVLALAASPKGVVALQFVTSAAAAAAELAHKASGAVRGAALVPAHADSPATRWLAQVKAHLASPGSCPLDFPLDLSSGTAFQRKVWSLMREKVGKAGQSISYGEFAALAGLPGGARAVGNACGKNPVLLAIPCHRVLAANGKLGGFTGGIDLKAQLLSGERSCSVLRGL